LTDKPLPEILRNLADYLEQDYSQNPYHPSWMKRCLTDFNKLREQQKDRVLLVLGQEAGKNAAERKKLFQKAMLTRQFGYAIVQAAIQQEASKASDKQEAVKQESTK
jgi:hypothetical protein